jgi:ubiquinone/menaquinone biosynthesis C-methylase UbiE
VRAYYHARAPEYDDWFLGIGRFAQLERPGWQEDLAALIDVISALPPARTLDVACGTGFITRHLQGEITGLDQSEKMLEIARERLPEARLLHGDALRLPFDDLAFDRLFTSHFYGHLECDDRAAFLAQARRVAPELVVADAAIRPDHGPEEWQERALRDGSRFTVYKRYFDPEQLAAEIGGGTVLHASRWFVVVRSPR